MLEDIGGTNVLPYLITAFQDSDGGVRSSAVTAMGKVGGPTALAYLLEGLEDKERLVRWHAAQALSEAKDIDNAAVPHLVKVLKDEEEYVRYYAVKALGQIGDPAAVPHLLSLVEDGEKDVWGAAIDTIRQTGVTAIPPLLTALKRGNLFIRSASTIALFWLVTTIQNIRPLKRVRRALWGRITEVKTVFPSPVSQGAKIALESVNFQLDILRVARLAFADPLDSPLPSKLIKRRFFCGLRLAVAVAVAVLVEMAASLLSDRLTVLLPTGIAGGVILVVALLFLFGVNRKLDS